MGSLTQVTVGSCKRESVVLLQTSSESKVYKQSDKSYKWVFLNIFHFKPFNIQNGKRVSGGLYKAKFGISISRFQYYGCAYQNDFVFPKRLVVMESGGF